MNYKTQFSFSRAINALLKRGSLLDAEESFDAEVRRRIESTEALLQLRASNLPNTLSFYAPILPRLRRDVSAGAGGAGVVSREDIGPFSDLLQYSATIQQGAQLLANVQGDLSAGVSASLPAPSWIAETGAAPDTNQVFTKLDLKPKRVSAKIIVSSMLLSASPDAEALITADLGRSLSSQLDRSIYYGSGGDAPTGIKNDTNINKLTGLTWDNLCELESLCAGADVTEVSFGYVTSPAVRKTLKTTMVSAGAGPIWQYLTRPLSSNVINSAEVFAGCFDNLLIVTWALEVQVNPYTLAEAGKVEITRHLFCNFAFRKPTAFGVIA
jgi:HK97 family phage major capsid protein